MVLQEVGESILTWFDGKLSRLNKSDVDLDIPVSDYEFTSTPSTQVMIEEIFSYSITVNYVGGVEYTLVKAPSGMVINQNEITWMPSDSDIGQSTVIIRAIIDDQVILQSFTIDISAPFSLCNNLSDINTKFIRQKS